jgi:hypothetical protein
MDYKHNRVRRYREIITVFAKYGFGLLLGQLGLRYALRRKDKISDADTAPG